MNPRWKSSAAPASRRSAGAGSRSRALGRPRLEERKSRSMSAAWSSSRPAGADVYALAVDRIHDHEELGEAGTPASWPRASMPEPRLPTTGARSSCSTLRALPRSKRQAGDARTYIAHCRRTCFGIGGRDAGPAFPRSRRSASGHAPRGGRSDRGSAVGFHPPRRASSGPARRDDPPAGRRQW